MDNVDWFVRRPWFWLKRQMYNAWPMQVWLMGLFGLAYLLYFYRQPVHGFFDHYLPHWLNERFEVQHNPQGQVIANSGKPRWTYLLPAAAGVIGGTGALITYIFNHRQRDLQFDRSELEDRFKDVQDRFSGDDKKTRASAARRLADIGIATAPGKAKTFTRRNRPFFLRAAQQLAIALYMEEDAEVRAAVAGGLVTLIRASAGRPGEALHNAVLGELGDANRVARKAYIQSLAEYSNLVPDVAAQEYCDLLCTVSPFLYVVEQAEAARNLARQSLPTIQYLMTRTEFDSHKAIHGLRKNPLAHSKEWREAHNIALNNVADKASRLISTRDVIAFALRQKRHRTHFGYPSGIWELDLSDTFLVGADLRNTQLQGVNLERAQLYRAKIQGAHLEGANLQEAKLQNADLEFAKLKGADLTAANLHATHTYNANFQNAILYGANMDSVDLSTVRLQGAKVAGSNLDAAYALNDSWREADFFYERLEGDYGLKERLKIKFPPDST